MRGELCSPVGGKPPRVADAVEPLLVERGGFFRHRLDAADKSLVRIAEPFDVAGPIVAGSIDAITPRLPGLICRCSRQAQKNLTER